MNNPRIFYLPNYLSTSILWLSANSGHSTFSKINRLMHLGLPFRLSIFSG